MKRKNYMGIVNYETKCNQKNRNIKLDQVRGGKLAVSSDQRERRQGLNTVLWRKIPRENCSHNCKPEHKHL